MPRRAVSPIRSISMSLTPEGHVSRVLNGLALDPDTVRLALVEAGQGRIGSLVDRLHVLCYGLDPLTGASTALAQSHAEDRRHA